MKLQVTSQNSANVGSQNKTEPDDKFRSNLKFKKFITSLLSHVYSFLQREGLVFLNTVDAFPVLFQRLIHSQGIRISSVQNKT